MSRISCLSAKVANLNVADGSVVNCSLLTAHSSSTRGVKVGLAHQGSGLWQPWTLEGVGHHPVYECGDIDCSPGQRVRPSLPEFRSSSFNSTAGSPGVCKNTSETNRGIRVGTAVNTTHLERHKFPARVVHMCISNFFGSR